MGKRVSQLGEITTIDDNDILYGVDISDLTHSPDGTSVRFKKSNLLKEVNSRAGDIESDVSDLQGIISGLLDFFYPIGTIYETTSSDLDTTTKMDAHFGGTWEAYGTGRVLVAKSTDTEFDTIGETGGYKGNNLQVVTGGYGLQSGSFYFSDRIVVGKSGITQTSEDKGNLQPYIVVYRYRRTA